MMLSFRTMFDRAARRATRRAHRLPLRRDVYFARMRRGRDRVARGEPDGPTWSSPARRPRSPASSMAARRSTASASRATCGWPGASRPLPVPDKVAARCLRRAAPWLKAHADDRHPQRQPRQPHRHGDGRARQDGQGARPVRHRQRHGGAGVHRGRRARARPRPGLCLRSGHDARDLRRLRAQPPGDGPGLSRHRQVDPYRAGRGAAELAADPHQPRRPYQPHRPGRPRRDRAARRPAGHRIPRGPAALGAAAPGRPGVRRI